jgi:hypothetical protein
MARELKKKSKIFIGLDQTGAVSANGSPRPLPAVAFVMKSPTALHLEVNNLKSFNKKCLREWILNLGGSWESAIVVIDSVLGLPRDIARSNRQGAHRWIWSLFARAAQAPSYGKSSGEQFFQSIYSCSDLSVPARRAEERAGANSVFKNKPAQRNIQTGTFRVWKDLGGNELQWCDIFPFSGLRGSQLRPLVFEGYPSWVWKKYWNESKRDSARCVHLLERYCTHLQISSAQKKILNASADLADAAALAWLGWHLAQTRKLKNLPKRQLQRVLEGEGWILGLDEK